MRSDSVKTGTAQAPHRSLFNALGFTEEERRRPMIGIVSSFNEIVPGHMNLDKITEAVKKASVEIRKRKKIKELIPDTALTDVPRYQYKDYINQTLDYIDTHFSDPELSLKKIASDVLFMNVDYLSREFLRQTGQKFTDYLTKQRITKAKALLKNASYEKINVIAEQVGFSNNPQYFAQLFKAATGQTPKAWAKMQQASEKET